MASIYLLRHGEYDNPRNILPGRLPVPLSAKGQEQAQRLSAYFADKNISTIYSSAVERCKQTIQPLIEKGIPVVYDPRLLETLSSYQGFWETNWHGDGYHFFSHRDELGGEGIPEMQARMVDFWEEIAPQVTENIIICSHGDPLQVLYAHIHKLPLVTESAHQSVIPGWLERGEFLELIWEDGVLVKTLPAVMT
jgi:broad specificity phosphatase PhoE